MRVHRRDMQRLSGKNQKTSCRREGVESKELRRSYSLKMREAGVRPQQLYGAL